MTPLLFSMGSLSLGGTRIFNGTVALEVGLYAILTTDLLDAFTQTLSVRYDNVTLGFVFSGGGLSTSSVLHVGFVASLTGKL